jgi:hypothetical protein
LGRSSGSGGGTLRGPMYVQMTPFRSMHGYVVARIFWLNRFPGASLGMSKHCPSI